LGSSSFIDDWNLLGIIILIMSFVKLEKELAKYKGNRTA
jgi:hypothetical protein